jgi:hypothetical protein
MHALGFAAIMLVLIIVGSRLVISAIERDFKRFQEKERNE